MFTVRSGHSLWWFGVYKIQEWYLAPTCKAWEPNHWDISLSPFILGWGNLPVCAQETQESFPMNLMHLEQWFNARIKDVALSRPCCAVDYFGHSDCVWKPWGLHLAVLGGTIAPGIKFELARYKAFTLTPLLSFQTSTSFTFIYINLLSAASLKCQTTEDEAQHVSSVLMS